MTTTISINGTAGTGKTTRLLEMVNEQMKRTSTRDITLCTFRRFAADDLKRRLGYEPTEIKNVSTIHGICYRLLGLKPDDVMQPPDLKEFCDEHGLGDISGYSFDWRNSGSHKSNHTKALFDFYTWIKNTGTPVTKIGMYPKKPSQR